MGLSFDDVTQDDGSTLRVLSINNLTIDSDSTLRIIGDDPLAVARATATTQTAAQVEMAGPPTPRQQVEVAVASAETVVS